jgi:hypothetical protein
MNRPDPVSSADEPVRPPSPEEVTTDCYHGVNLAPSTLESLVTWDVSVHARREQDRLLRHYPAPQTKGGY